MDKTKVKEAFESLKAAWTKFSAEEVTPTPVEPVALASVTTADGLVLEVEGEVKEGSKVSTKDADGNLIPAPNGEYILEDNSSVMVAEGVITVVLPPASEVAEPEVMSDEVKTEMASLKEANVKIAHDFAAYVAKTDLALTNLNDLNKSLFAMVEVLSNEPSAEVAETPKATFNKKDSKDARIALIAAQLKNLNKK